MVSEQSVLRPESMDEMEQQIMLEMSKQIEDNKQATDDLKAQMADLTKSQADLCKSALHMEAMLSQFISQNSGQTSRASGLNASPSGCLMISTMPFLPTRIEAQASPHQESSQQSTNGNDKTVAHQLFDQMPQRKAEEEKQQTEALGSELNIMLIELKAMTANREATMSKFLSQTSIPPQPPDPPDFNQFGQRLCKLEFPVFDGTLLDCWIVEVDRFFELEQYGNEEKLDLISLGLEGAALKWFRKHRREFTDWTDIKRKLMARFGLIKGCFPREVLPKEKFINKVPIPSLEPGRRYHKESLVVVNDLSYDLGCVIGKTIGCIGDSEVGQDNSLDEEEFNRVWEPGGVLIEHDKWKGSEKCYELSRVVRLMQGLPSTRWSYGKVAELTQELQQTKTYLKGIKLKDLDRLAACSCVDTKMWHCVKHETQQTDFHVWHRWKNKAEKLPADYALLELMMLGLVSFQPNKGTGIVGTKEKLYDRLSLANYVWKPGELLFVQDQWDWISEVHNMGSVLKMMQRFHGLHLQEIISMDMKLREVIVHDVLSVKVFLSVCNRKSEAQLGVYLLEHHNFKIAGGLIYGDVNFYLKHKWRSKVSQSFSELKQRILVSLWKSLGYLMEAHGSKYEGLVCALERKKLRTIENDIDHLKKLLETMEGLDQKISCGLLCGNGKFHLKHKWKSRLIQALSGLQFGVDNIVPITSHVKVAYSVLGLEVFEENVVLFTGPDKLLFSNNHKLLHPEIGFCTQYNHLELLSTEHQSSPGLDYFTYLNFIWKQVLSCGCEAGHISSRIVPVGDVHGFVTCSKLQTGDEIQEKRLLFLNNNNKIDHAVKENWFHNEPMISGVFHLQRPPELIDLHGNLDFITKAIVQWKEHPPDQFSQAFILEDKDALKREVL